MASPDYPCVCCSRRLLQRHLCASRRPRRSSNRTLRAIPPAQRRSSRSNGMVVAQEARAARIGVEILDRGGNAVDAAVAVGFALAVTYPRAGNIGGGGFMVIHLAKERRRTSPSTIARPRRPRRRATCSSTPRASPIRRSRATAGLRSACPAPSRAWRWRTQKYGSGKLSLADLIAPAIELARNGFAVEDDTADSLPRARERLARWPSTAGFSSRTAAAAATRRPPDPVRSRRHAATPSRRRARSAFYEGRDRRPDRRRGAQRRRHHDRGRPEELSRRCCARRCAAPIAATTSSRCRRPRPAACI